MTKKDRALEFLKLVSTGNVKDAVAKHVGPGFKHHNIYFPGDADTLFAAMGEAATKQPDKSLTVKRALEDGDLVAVHSHVKQNKQDLGVSVVHMFRFQKDKVVEFWDVIMPLTADSPNKNGAF